VSVLEMVKLVEKVSGKKVPYKVVERRPGDLAEVWCDASKAEKEL
jgi:UDP-glucose 4-epimerase